MNLSANEDLNLISKACNGDLEEVRRLLREGADVNARRDTDGATALWVASQQGHLKVVRELLNHDKVDVNVRLDADGTTALWEASHQGQLEVVRELLNHDKVDVNVRRSTDGATVLWEPSHQGHTKVVRALLNHKKVDVNAQRETDGSTALYTASEYNRVEVVRELLDHKEINVNVESIGGLIALDVATRRNRVAVKLAFRDHYRALEQVIQDRASLSNVMSTRSAPPVELTHKYIKDCIIHDRELGSGAFGAVFLAEDRILKKQFAVKKIKVDQFSDKKIIKIRETFQRELSTLKRFRHPNLIALYGYNLEGDRLEQFLVYEYVARGSLDGFLKNDGMRARLSAEKRLLIMFELARAVHFLHTARFEDWKVYHRDIKSANICLSEDFTARLIDCGLAQFVRGENSNANQGSIEITDSHERAAGTMRYMCPKHMADELKGTPSPYIPACDVYSIGVVMTELILGCLHLCEADVNVNKYVEDGGLKRLQDDSDRSIIWNEKYLEPVCAIAITCMDPDPCRRLTTESLIDELWNALDSDLQRGGHGQLSGDQCVACNHYVAEIYCSTSEPRHSLCLPCIQNKVSHYPYGRHDALCPIGGCSSESLQDAALREHLREEIYTQYEAQRETQRLFNDCLRQLRVGQMMVNDTSDGFEQQERTLHRVEEGVGAAKQSFQKQLLLLQKWGKGLDMPCPNLVWLTPTSIKKEELENPEEWIKKSTQTYQVVFICANSCGPGHAPFIIDMPREWIVMIAPWVLLCLRVLECITSEKDLPFPIPDVSFDKKKELLNAFFDALVDVETKLVLSHCESLLEERTTLIDTSDEVPPFTGDAFKILAEKAIEEKQWRPPQMVPVCFSNKMIMWVKADGT